MTDYARCNLVIQDENGNIVDGASVEVRRESDLGLPVLYSTRDGSGSPLGNPFTAASGADAGFHVAGGAYKITATHGSFTRIWRYVPVATGAEYDLLTIYASAALTGTPTAPTAALGTDTTQIATMAAIMDMYQAITGTVDSPFDTLAELAAQIAAIIATPSSLPRSYLAGLALSNNGSDATNDIDIAAGTCRDQSNSVNITLSALTKRLDANWAAGTNQGMRNSGAAIADTTYHIYAVAKAAGADPDIYAHASATPATVLTALQAETGGSAYTVVRRIGSIVRVSGAILAFSQLGDEFLVVTPVLDFNTTVTTTGTTITLGSIPTGVKMWALLNVTGATSDGYYLSSFEQADQAPSLTVAPLRSAVTNASFQQTYRMSRIRTNTSAQIRGRSEAINSTIRIATLGWIDRRGRDD